MPILTCAEKGNLAAIQANDLSQGGKFRTLIPCGYIVKWHTVQASLRHLPSIPPVCKSENSRGNESSEPPAGSIHCHLQRFWGCQVWNKYCQGVSVDRISLIKVLLIANPTKCPTATRMLQHSWLADVDMEQWTDVESGPNPAFRDFANCWLSVTEDEWFDNFTRFIDTEKVWLQVVYDDDAVRKLVPIAKIMVEGLFILGFKKEIAMQLSILVLYDLVNWFVLHSFLDPKSYRATWYTGTPIRIVYRWAKTAARWTPPYERALLTVIKRWQRFHEDQRGRTMNCIPTSSGLSTNSVRKAVAIQFSLVGNDREARETFQDLLDSCTSNDNFDILGCLYTLSGNCSLC